MAKMNATDSMLLFFQGSTLLHIAASTSLIEAAQEMVANVIVSIGTAVKDVNQANIAVKDVQVGLFVCGHHD